MKLTVCVTKYELGLQNEARIICVSATSCLPSEIMKTSTLPDEKQDYRAERAMEILDRWAERLNGHHSQKRSHSRVPLRTEIIVYVPDKQGSAGEFTDSKSFKAWTRNISSNGVSFLYSRYVKLEHFVVGLQTGQGLIWFNAECVRCRQVHEGYWEYGVRLTERASA